MPSSSKQSCFVQQWFHLGMIFGFVLSCVPNLWEAMLFVSRGVLYLGMLFSIAVQAL